MSGKFSAPVETGYKTHNAFETETHIIVCGDPEEYENHNCDEMGCTSVSHVLFRFDKDLLSQLATITEERDKLKLQLAGRTYCHSDEQINEDLDTSEAACADLMKLNDKLTEEAQSSYGVFQTLMNIGDTLRSRGFVADISNSVDQRVIDIAQSYDKLKVLIGVAKCPACDGSGAIGRGTGGQTGCRSDVEWEQCQWCDEKDIALKATK